MFRARILVNKKILYRSDSYFQILKVVNMSTDYIFRTYSSGDEDKISELLTQVFGGWPRIDSDMSPIEY
jgi:hypothetical protein